MHFPFADTEELNLFKENDNVIYYEMARKIALLEMQATGFTKDMNWEGYHLSEKPIVIYDLNSTPRYYDYIALDTESNPIGTIRVNATKEESTIIKSVFSKTFNYNELLSKSSVTNPSFFMNWRGDEFVGLKSKYGERPTSLVSTQTGEVLAPIDIKELKKHQIIEELTQNVFPTLLPKDNRAFENIPSHLIQNDTIREEIEFYKTVDVEFVKKSMELSLIQSEEEAKAFWQSIAEIEPELEKATDTEIKDTNSKFFGRIFRWFRRVFDFNTNKDRHPIHKYTNNEKIKSYGHLNDWCGPWVCGYILYVNQGVDKYNFFENCSSTFGELGILNYALRIFGKPMTPVEMGWSMPIASKGRIWINPVPHFADLHAYDHIRYRKKPAIRLCSNKGELHWTLAYGARATGGYFWRNYYFLQIDNGSKIKDRYQNPDKDAYYTKVDWWNPWLLVWD